MRVRKRFVYVFMFCVVDFFNYYLGSGSIVGGNEEEIREWNKVVGRRESSFKCEVLEFFVWGTFFINIVFGGDGFGFW